MRGAQNKVKRKSIFEYVRERADMAFIQETHCTKKIEEVSRKQWGGQAIFAHRETNKRGVCVLVNRAYPIKFLNVLNVEQGRFIIVDCLIQEKLVTMCNVYGPNTDEPRFFQGIVHK